LVLLGLEKKKLKQRNLVGLCIHVCLQLGKLTIAPNNLAPNTVSYIYIYIYNLSPHLRVRVSERKD